jgi:pyruvate kinase
MRRAKILATLGPASANEQVLTGFFRAGVDAIRLNFSHGTPEQHRANAALVRRVSAAVGRTVAILGDLSGPKIRVGTFAQGPVELVPGALFVLTTEPVAGDATQVSMTYPLANDLRAGDVLLLDDGLLRLRVEEVAPPRLITRVEIGGPLSDKKGINVPGARLNTSAVTEKDRQDILLAREIGVDYLALSFVRSPRDVEECKALAGPVPVIAKLEKPEAVEQLEAIIAASDGLMVARGDLGIEIGSEKVPLVQKRAITAVNAAGKLVITATQMLDSMIRHPRPTRAEAADVANAVLDGSDVLMLSGESAAGLYPLEAVTMMDAIIREVEGSPLYDAQPAPSSFGRAWEFGNACTRAAAITSRSVPLAAVVVSTTSGLTASLLAEYRPHAPIVAVTPEIGTARRLALEWGVIPVQGDLRGAPGEALERAEQAARAAVGAKAGDSLAIVLGSATGPGSKALVLRTLH